MPVAATPAPAGREFDLEPADNTRLANLCGALDENLRHIEERLGVRIQRRGATFRIAGEQAARAEDVLRAALRAQRRGGRHARARAPDAARAGVAVRPARRQRLPGRARAARRRSARAVPTSAIIWSTSARATSPSASDLPAPARPILRSPAPSRRCRPTACGAWCWCARRSRPASGSAFCPGTSPRRSTRICARCTTRSTR